MEVIIDGNCTGTAWLTLGKGSVPQSILTNAHGNGHEDLWRDLSAAATGSVFDIHFQHRRSNKRSRGRTNQNIARGYA